MRGCQAARLNGRQNFSGLALSLAIHTTFTVFHGRMEECLILNRTDHNISFFLTFMRIRDIVLYFRAVGE